MSKNSDGSFFSVKMFGANFPRQVFEDIYFLQLAYFIKIALVPRYIPSKLDLMKKKGFKKYLSKGFQAKWKPVALA